MSKSATTTPPRDRFPAQRCLLLAVIAAFAIGLPAAADARSKGRQTVGSVPTVTDPATVAAGAVTPASLRAANDVVTVKSIVETPTGAIRKGATVGKTSAAATADAVPPSAAPQRPKDWYPESHSYLRPYHYKWRYWTPG